MIYSLFQMMDHGKTEKWKVREHISLRMAANMTGYLREIYRMAKVKLSILEERFTLGNGIEATLTVCVHRLRKIVIIVLALVFLKQPIRVRTITV